MASGLNRVAIGLVALSMRLDAYAMKRGGYVIVKGIEKVRQELDEA